ncbi:MAG: MoaD/ThiS family protein [Chloroflexota bacterium]
MPEVWIPTMMQHLAGGQQRVQVPGKTVRQVIDQLAERFPELRDKLCQDNEIMPGIAVVVDGETSGLGMLQPVNENSEVHFLPAIGGGAA